MPISYNCLGMALTGTPSFQGAGERNGAEVPDVSGEMIYVIENKGFYGDLF
jgi:hypothetical protein